MATKVSREGRRASPPLATDLDPDPKKTASRARQHDDLRTSALREAALVRGELLRAGHVPNVSELRAVARERVEEASRVGGPLDTLALALVVQTARGGAPRVPDDAAVDAVAAVLSAGRASWAAAGGGQGAAVRNAREGAIRRATHDAMIAIGFPSGATERRARDVPSARRAPNARLVAVLATPPVDHAQRAMEHVQALALRSTSPAAHDAFEVIRVGLYVLLGEPLPCPDDCLSRLRDHLRGAGAGPNAEGDFRKLVDIIAKRTEVVTRLRGQGYTDGNILREESKGLAREIRTAFPIFPENVTRHMESNGKVRSWEEALSTTCGAALFRWVSGRPMEGKLSTNGVAAELIILAAPAFHAPAGETRLDPREWTEENRAHLSTTIAKAVAKKSTRRTGHKAAGNHQLPAVHQVTSAVAAPHGGCMVTSPKPNGRQKLRIAERGSVALRSVDHYFSDDPKQLATTREHIERALRELGWPEMIRSSDRLVSS